MVDWRDLLNNMDRVVDNRFAEPVEFHPWAGSSYSNRGGPDPEREVLVTRGILSGPGAQVTGESGTLGGGLDRRVVTQMFWLSITDENCGPLSSWKARDRIFFPWRGEWYEIDYFDTSFTYRPTIQLIKIQVGSE